MQPSDSQKRNSGHTGPRTPEGKAIASCNALKHGLRSEKTILRDEDPAEYASLLETWFNSYPSSHDDITSNLIELTANAHWRLKRALRRLDEIEYELPKSAYTTSEENERLYANYLRYKNANERSFFRAYEALTLHVRRATPKHDLADAPAATAIQIIEQRLDISLADNKVTTTFSPTNDELQQTIEESPMPPLLIHRIIHIHDGLTTDISWSNPKDIISAGPSSFRQRLTFRNWLKAAHIERHFTAHQVPFNFNHPNSLPIIESDG
jgi:hypothetical protein